MSRTRLQCLPNFRGRSPAVAVLLLALLASGCTHYQRQSEGFRSQWRAGRVAEVARDLTTKADKEANGRDAVLWRLEQAAALRAAGEWERSTAAFAEADRRMAEFEAKSSVRVGQELLAALSNPANIAYEGRPYDKIMASTYTVLNHLAVGDRERARPEMFRAYQRQQDAVAGNARRIERAREEEAAAGRTEMVAAAKGDPRFQQQLAAASEPLRSIQLYADYVNPFTVWLDGLFFSANPADSSDLERARLSFQRAASYAPANPFIRADLEAVEAQFQGRPPGPRTYVIFETGSAPIREQVRIDIPIIFANVSYVGAAFPRLQPQGDYARSLSIRSAAGETATATVANMDAVVARDFQDEQPIIISRAVISAASKGTAAFFANQAAYSQDEGLGALVRVLTMAYQLAVNVADTRTWTTLPKEFQVARLATPADRRLELSAGGRAPMEVTLAPGEVNVVYVRSTSATAPLLVSQFTLR